MIAVAMASCDRWFGAGGEPLAANGNASDKSANSSDGRAAVRITRFERTKGIDYG